MSDDVEELRRQLEAERGLRIAADGENERLQAQIDAYAEDLGRLFQERHGHGHGDLAAELARARADVADESAQREALDALYSRSRAEAKGLSEQLETYGEELSKAYRQGRRAAGAKGRWWQRPVPFGLLSSGAGLLVGGMTYGALLAPSPPPPGDAMALTGTPGTGTPGMDVSVTVRPGVRIASNGSVGIPGMEGMPGVGIDPAGAAATAAALTLDGTPAASVDGSADATTSANASPGSVVAGLSALRSGAAGTTATAVASLAAEPNAATAAAGTPVPGLAATITALAGTSTAVVATASVGANTATAGASTATAGAGTAVAFAATASVEAATASVVAGTATAVAATASAVAGTATAVAATATQAAQPVSPTAPVRTIDAATKPEAPTPDQRRCSFEMNVPPLPSGGSYLVHFTQRQAADIVVLWSHRDGEVTLEVDGERGAGALALAPSADAEGTPRDVVASNVPAGDYRARLRNLASGSSRGTVVALFYDKPSACQPEPVGAIDEAAGPRADVPAPSPAVTAATPLSTNPTAVPATVAAQRPAPTPTVAPSPTPVLFARPRLDCRPYLRGPSGYLEIQPVARLDASGERLGSLPVRAKLVGPTAARVVTDQFVAAPGMTPRRLSLAGFGHYEFSVEADADLDTNCAWGYDHDQYR